MAPQNMPAAEVDVTAALVRELLLEQHPDLADHPDVADVADLAVHTVANGWDNVILRLGDDLAVRIPRRAAAAALVENEQRVLPQLAPRLPLAIPAPLRIGVPSENVGYPWAWSVIPWLPGSIAAERRLDDPDREAQRLGSFLSALHVDAPSEAPANPFRGHFIADNDVLFRERLALLGASDGVDAGRAERRWSGLLHDTAPWPHPSVWLHADLHLANLLVDDRSNGSELVGVIDWGDVCAGDPATDLSIAWSLFDAPQRQVFRAAAGGVRPVDDDTWRRAEAWALHFAVIYVLHSADNRTMTGIGRRLVRSLGVAAD